MRVGGIQGEADLIIEGEVGEDQEEEEAAEEEGEGIDHKSLNLSSSK